MRQIIVAMLTCLMVLSFMACQNENPAGSDDGQDVQSTLQSKESEWDTNPIYEDENENQKADVEKPEANADDSTRKETSDEELCDGVPLADPWGVYVSAENINPKGLTLVCRQTGGDAQGELQTGSYYRIEYYESKSDEWIPLEHSVENLAWTTEAWMIPKDSTVTWNVNWEFLHGELDPGLYRIVKEIMDFKGTGDYEQREYFAEFGIVD